MFTRYIEYKFSISSSFPDSLKPDSRPRLDTGTRIPIAVTAGTGSLKIRVSEQVFDQIRVQGSIPLTKGDFKIYFNKYLDNFILFNFVLLMSDVSLRAPDPV